MTTLTDITAQLSEPFALDEIGFLPKGKVERDGKTLCMALPYADPRVYEDRLNALAPGEWSTPAPIALVAGNKLICYVTVIIYGVPHTDVGEATNNEENTGTEAWAQAFKRACSQFGLGRYLYDLEKEWVPFNPQKKQIDLDKAGLRAIVQKMYRKAGLAVPGTVEPKPARPQTTLRTGDGSPVVVKQQHTPKTLFEQGKRNGLWSETSISKFYAKASEISGRLQSQTHWDMTPSEKAEMAQQIYEQMPAAVAGAN